MRKTIFPLLFVLFVSVPGKSQNIVLHAGVNISNMQINYYDNTYTTDRFPIFSPDIGLGYEYYLNERISIKPGIAYSRHGKLIAMDLGANYYYEEKFTINYIELPFLFCYNFNPRTTWGYALNISAGPYVAYGFNGMVTSDNTAFVSEESLFLGGDGIERNDYGLILKVGFGYTRDQISVGIVMGLKNLAIIGGDYTDFRRIGLSFNYVRNIDFGPHALRIIKKRFF